MRFLGHGQCFRHCLLMPTLPFISPPPLSQSPICVAEKTLNYNTRFNFSFNHSIATNSVSRSRVFPYLRPTIVRIRAKRGKYRRDTGRSRVWTRPWRRRKKNRKMCRRRKWEVKDKVKRFFFFSKSLMLRNHHSTKKSITWVPNGNTYKTTQPP